MIPTRERLAAEIEAAGGGADTAHLVVAARAGAYDDYASESATPITDLIRDLRAAADATHRRAVRERLRALAARARTGDFDATRAEAQAWAASPEGRAAYRDLAGGNGGPW